MRSVGSSGGGEGFLVSWLICGAVVGNDVVFPGRGEDVVEGTWGGTLFLEFGEVDCRCSVGPGVGRGSVDPILGVRMAVPPDEEKITGFHWWDSMSLRLDLLCHTVVPFGLRQITHDIW